MKFNGQTENSHKHIHVYGLLRFFTFLILPIYNNIRTELLFVIAHI